MDRKIYPRIGQPCPKTWDSLDGDAQKRFCSECQHHVHNLSEMSPEEADTLLRTPGRKCVAYTVTAETREFSVSLWKFWSRFRFFRPLGAVLTVVVALFGSSCATTSRKEAACLPPQDEKAVVNEETDGKTVLTLGYMLEERPLWKRILGIR